MTQPMFEAVEPKSIKGAKAVGTEAFNVPHGDKSLTVISPTKVITRDGVIVGLVSPYKLGLKATGLDMSVSAYSSDPLEVVKSFGIRYEVVAVRGVPTQPAYILLKD